MDVAVDCSCVAKEERTGVARYCSSLIAALPGAIGPDDTVTLLYRVSRWGRREWFQRVDDPRFKLGYFNDKVVSFGIPRVDAFHGPDVRIPILPNVPAVSTVHDLSALDVAGIADEEFRQAKARDLADVAFRAAVILCVSEFTEQAFLDRFPAGRGKTRIVPGGLPPRFGAVAPADLDAVLARRRLRRPYLLFVGQIAARKNLKPLLATFEALQSRAAFRDLCLVMAGPVLTGGDAVVAAAHASKSDASIRFLGFVGDDELPALYAGALAFCFPGKSEGFGIPILESMACGTPVVAARAAAIPSTAGDAAVLVDPDDPDAWVAALERVATDSAVRGDLIARGLMRAAQFSWAETARRTVEAYRDAASLGASA